MTESVRSTDCVKVHFSDLRGKGIRIEDYVCLLGCNPKIVGSIESDSLKGWLLVTPARSVNELNGYLRQVERDLSIGRLVVEGFEERRFASSQSNPRGVAWRELVHRGLVSELPRGRVAYRGSFAEVVQAIDDFLLAWASTFGAEAVHLPKVVDLETFESLGLVEEFPQYAFFVSPIRRDPEVLSTFQRETRSPRALKAYLDTPIGCLKTSACSLLYPLLRGTSYAAPSYFTLLGECTRDEGMTTQTLERLTEFTMREVVFVGARDRLPEFQARCLALMEDLARALDVNARLVQANDSFFATNYATLKLMQDLGCRKIELTMQIPESGSTVAVSSFNNHESTFAKKYGIQSQGKPATTACIGFGLERLAYAAVAYHGVDVAEIARLLHPLRDRPAPPMPGVGGTSSPADEEV